MSYTFLATVAPLCALAQTSEPTSKPDAVATTMPPVVWPVRETYRRLFTDRAVILSPTAATPTRTIRDAMLLHTHGQIVAIDPATGRRQWPQPVAGPHEPTLIGSDESRYILATPHRIFALRQADGHLAWTFGNRPPNDPGVDPESLTVWEDHAMSAGRLVARSNRGELICLDLLDGNMRWRREAIANVVDGSLVVNDRHLCYVHRSRRHGSLCVLDAASGKTIRTMSLDGDTLSQSLVLTTDGALLALRSRTMLCVELGTGAVRWRVRTSGRFVVSTLITSDDGVFISDDGSHVTQYDLRTGHVLWKTPPIGMPEGGGGLWVQLAAGRLLTAAWGILIASNPADGRVLWVAHNPPGVQSQPPFLAGDAVVTVEIATSRAVTRLRESERDLMVPPGSRRYRMRRFNLSDGREQPVIAGGELVTPPLGAFAQVSAQRNTLMILDGERLIGYVGGNVAAPHQDATSVQTQPREQ